MWPSLVGEFSNEQSIGWCGHTGVLKVKRISCGVEELAGKSKQQTGTGLSPVDFLS